MLSLKSNVDLIGLQPQIVVAIVAVHAICDQFGFPCVITSANDSKHSFTSLHHVGAAIDIRTSDPDGEWHMFEDDRENIVALLNECLGQDFDIIDEEDHIHIEYQRKQR